MLATAALASTPRSLPRDEGRHRSTYCSQCPRASSGRIQRSTAARRAFRRLHPCPSTGETAGPCPGYIIDHRIALKRGGLDIPANMQWQTAAEARAKDRHE
jgi:hypothetical protein